MPDDAELLRRYAATRAEDAFAELVRRHLDGVYSAALRRVGGDTHLAEDVAQQVFVALAQKAVRLSRHPVLAGWLHAATRHEAAHVVRYERRRKAREQEAQTMHDLNSETAPEADWSRVAPVLDEALDRLSETERTAVLLRYVERRPFGEIAAALRLTEDAARMRVNRALDKLRGLLARRGIASTAAALSLALTNHAVVAAPASLATAVTGASLAAAPVGASAAASLLSFMSTTKATLGIAVVAIIAALGTATYEIRESRAAEAALATARQGYDALVAKRRDLAQQAQTAEQDAARLKQAVADAHAAQAAAATSQAAKAAAAWDPVAEGKAFLARHPEVKQALIASKIAEIDFRYSALYRSLGLTPAQIAQFQTIMLASGSGGWVNRLLVPELKEMVFSIVDTDQTQNGTRRLRELLGDDGYRQFTEFNRVDSARQLAVQVASSLYFTEAPMTPAQSEQLIQILDNNRSPRSGPQVSPFDWDAVLAQARDVLSAPQLAAVNGLRVSAQHNQAMAGGNVLPIAPAPTSALKPANPPSP
jgi:RNA polymerase sigma factor (sigma-70 family)